MHVRDAMSVLVLVVLGKMQISDAWMIKSKRRNQVCADD
jgi:hypothetical protein